MAYVIEAEQILRVETKLGAAVQKSVNLLPVLRSGKSSPYRHCRLVKHIILLYGFEVLNLNKSQLNSLDFVANRFLMKLFNTNNMQIIEFCCEQFNFILPSRQIANRRDKFINSDSQRTNLLTVC